MIDLGRRMEMILNGAAIADANRLRTEAEEAREAAAAKAAQVVTPAVLHAEETAPVADVVEVAADRQTLLRLAYIARLGVLTGEQFATVSGRLDAAQIEVPNGSGGVVGLAY